MTRDDPATPMRCEVVVAGPVAAAVLTRLRTRFDVSSTPGGDGDTVLVVDGADQATQRAFLICLWDSGQVVVGLSSLPRWTGRSRPSAVGSGKDLV